MKGNMYLGWALLWTALCYSFLVSLAAIGGLSSHFGMLIVLVQAPIAFAFFASSLAVAQLCRPIIAAGDKWLHLPIALVVTLVNVTLFSLVVTITSMSPAGLYAWLVVAQNALLFALLGVASQLFMKWAHTRETAHA